jgi:DNA-binding NarL/FixJ family response regulator
VIPQSRFALLHGRNHILLPHEAAWREFFSEVRSFLDGPESASGAGGFDALSPRENGVLELIARGLDNAQIAARLELSEKTVRNHITHIFEKLQVETRAQAIVRARQAGLGQR